MKVLKAVMAVGMLVAAFFIGRAALLQFENYQEYGMMNRTPFHAFNIVVLTVLAVTILVITVYLIAEIPEDRRPSLGNLSRVIFFGSVGVVTFAIGLYENNVNAGKVYPQHHAFHSGDAFAVVMVGIWLILAALGCMLYDIISGHEGARPASEDKPTNETEDEPSTESFPDASVIIIDHFAPVEPPEYEAAVSGSYDLEGGGKLHFKVNVNGESSDEVAGAAQSLLETVLTEDD